MKSILNGILVLTVPFSLFYLSLPISQVLLVTLAVIVVAYFLNNDSQNARLPPGPPGFPLIGRLPFVLFRKSKSKFEDMIERHEKYGPIFCQKLGDTLTIMVSDYDMIKELSMHPDLQLRPEQDMFREANKGFGIIAAEGTLWKHQRRFLLNSLRNSGMGKITMEQKINDELEQVKDVFQKSRGQPLQIHTLMEKSTSNIMFSLAFNKQFDYDDLQFLRRIKALDEYFRLIGTIGFLSLLSFLKPFFGFILRKIHATVKVLKSQSQELIDEHLKNLDPDDPRDLLDNYLIEMQKKPTSEDEEYHKTFFDEQLKFLILDLFAAGTETSSTTIRWGLLYMIHNPDIQTKVQKELDDVLGSEGIPSTEHKLKLPYTVATLQEIERLGSVVSFSLPRSSDKPVKFREYVFPKRSRITFNLYAVHRDPKLWANPRKFDPSRFIDSEGKVFRPAYLLPFGSGRRVCPGEALGRMEIFLYFATLLKNFRFENPSGEPMPSFEELPGALRGPQDYKISCRPR